MSSQLETNGLATILWVACVLGAFLLFNIVFYTWWRLVKMVDSDKDSDDDEIDEEAGRVPAISPDTEIELSQVRANEGAAAAARGTSSSAEVQSDGHVSIEVRSSGSSTPAADNTLPKPLSLETRERDLTTPPPLASTAPTTPTVFALAGGTEYCINDRPHNTFYSVCISEEMLKTTEIWSVHGIQEEIAHCDGERDVKLKHLTDNAPVHFQVLSKTAPLLGFSHLECSAVQTARSYFESVDITIKIATGADVNSRRAAEWGLFMGSNFLKMICTALKHAVLLIADNLLFLAFIGFVLALIFSFYIPGFMEQKAHDYTNYHASQKLTSGIFAGTFIATMFHLWYLYVLKRTGVAPLWWSFLNVVSFVVLVVCLALASTLYHITQGKAHDHDFHTDDDFEGSGEFSTDDYAAGDDYGLDDYMYRRLLSGEPSNEEPWSKNAIERFSCFCEDKEGPTFMPTEIPTIASPVPTVVPTATTAPTNPTVQPSAVPTGPTFAPSLQKIKSSPVEYEFECTNASYYDANEQSCAMNCGVCAPTYRDPFLTFTSIGALYIFLLMFMMHYRWYFLPCFGWKLNYVPIPFPTIGISLTAHQLQVRVTMHGSKAFGYPLVSKMTVVHYHKLETAINALVKADKIKRPGDMVRAMASSSTGNGSIARPYSVAY